MNSTEESIKQIPGKAEQDADPRIDLAAESTMLAMERTQLAWVRTVLGLITGGVAIDKGTELLHEARLATGEAFLKNGHLAGLLLTITSTLLMIIASGLYIKRMRELNKMRNIKTKLPAPATILSVFICLIGVLATYFLSIPW